MRQSAYDSVPRWRDRPPSGVSDEDRASALTRDSLLSGALPDGLSDLQLARIEQNLKAMETLAEASSPNLDAALGRLRRPARARWRLRLVLASLPVVLTAAGSLVAYQMGSRPRPIAQPAASPGPAAATAVAPTVAAPSPQDPPGPVVATPAADPLPVVAVPTPRGAGPARDEETDSVPAVTGFGSATAASTTGEGAPGPAVVGQEPAVGGPAAVAIGVLPRVAPPPGTAQARTTPQSKPTAVAAPAATRSAKLAAGLPRTKNNAPPGAGYSEPTSGSPELIRASQEILALDHALGLLRSKHDAQAALQALDDYLARFPAGLLGHEARVARVDALLMLKRSDEALLALEALPLDEHRRAAELQVVRGELRSRGDCLLAERDFSAVLERVRAATLEERALYGRASCRNKRGDVTGATQDLRRYVERFPNGPHAAWARRWLENAD